MSIVTLEILGRPVACISAQDRFTAEQISREPWFHRELRAHRSSGEPLWDGSTELSLRHPTQSEAAIVENRLEAHHLSDDSKGPEMRAIVFLVSLDSQGPSDVVDEGDDFPI